MAKKAVSMTYDELMTNVKSTAAEQSSLLAVFGLQVNPCLLHASLLLPAAKTHPDFPKARPIYAQMLTKQLDASCAQIKALLEAGDLQAVVPMFSLDVVNFSQEGFSPLQILQAVKEHFDANHDEQAVYNFRWLCAAIAKYAPNVLTPLHLRELGVERYVLELLGFPVPEPAADQYYDANDGANGANPDAAGGANFQSLGAFEFSQDQDQDLRGESTTDEPVKEPVKAPPKAAPKAAPKEAPAKEAAKPPTPKKPVNYITNPDTHYDKEIRALILDRETRKWATLDDEMAAKKVVFDEEYEKLKKDNRIAEVALTKRLENESKEQIARYDKDRADFEREKAIAEKDYENLSQGYVTVGLQGGVTAVKIPKYLFDQMTALKESPTVSDRSINKRVFMHIVNCLRNPKFRDLTIKTGGANIDPTKTNQIFKTLGIVEPKK